MIVTGRLDRAPRRRGRLVLAVVALVACLAGATCAGPCGPIGRRACLRGLQSMEGVDLSDGGARTCIADALLERLRPRSTWLDHHVTPPYVWRIFRLRGPPERVIVVSTAPTSFTKEASAIEVVLLREEGSVAACFELDAGQGNSTVSVGLRSEPRAGGTVLDLGIENRNRAGRLIVEREFWAVRGDELFAIRREDAAGRARRSWDRTRIARSAGGPGPCTLAADLTGDDCRARLASRDTRDVLAALHWLSDDYMVPDHPNMLLRDGLRSDQTVAARLAELRASPNPWLREGAGLALFKERWR